MWEKTHHIKDDEGSVCRSVASAVLLRVNTQSVSRRPLFTCSHVKILARAVGKLKHAARNLFVEKDARCSLVVLRIAALKPGAILSALNQKRIFNFNFIS